MGNFFSRRKETPATTPSGGGEEVLYKTSIIAPAKRFSKYSWQIHLLAAKSDLTDSITGRAPLGIMGVIFGTHSAIAIEREDAEGHHIVQLCDIRAVTGGEPVGLITDVRMGVFNITLGENAEILDRYAYSTSFRIWSHNAKYAKLAIEKDVFRTALGLARAFLAAESRLEEEAGAQGIASADHGRATFKGLEVFVGKQGFSDDSQYHLQDFLALCSAMIAPCKAGFGSEVAAEGERTALLDEARAFLSLCHSSLEREDKKTMFISENYPWMKEKNCFIPEPGELGLMPYDIAGSSGRYFGSTGCEDDGFNCTEWCRNKLQLMGIHSGKKNVQTPKSATLPKWLGGAYVQEDKSPQGATDESDSPVVVEV